MPHPPSAYDLHQQQRWTRHDAHLWIRHDYARWLKPGADPEELYPHLKREREAAESAKEDAVFDAWIENERRWIAAMREEVNELKAAQARRRLGGGEVQPGSAAHAGRQSARRAVDGSQWRRVKPRQGGQ